MGGSGQAAVFGSPDKLPIGRLTLVCAGRSVVLFRSLMKHQLAVPGSFFLALLPLTMPLLGTQPVFQACLAFPSFNHRMPQARAPNPRPINYRISDWYFLCKGILGGREV